MSNDLKYQIAVEARKMFFKYGLKSVSIDDIVGALSISKKVFYENFSGKNELVETVINGFIEEITQVEAELSETSDFIEKLHVFYLFMLNHFKMFNASFIYNVEKYYPNVYNNIEKFINGKFKSIFIMLISEGKKEKIFIEDINEEMFYLVHLKIFYTIIERDILPEKMLNDNVFKKIIKTFLIGISTIKGHVLIEEKFNTLN